GTAAPLGGADQLARVGRAVARAEAARLRVRGTDDDVRPDGGDRDGRHAPGGQPPPRLVWGVDLRAAGQAALPTCSRRRPMLTSDRPRLLAARRQAATRSAQSAATCEGGRGVSTRDTPGRATVVSSVR